MYSQGQSQTSLVHPWEKEQAADVKINKQN